MTAGVTVTDATGNTSSPSEPAMKDTVAGDLTLSIQTIEIDDVATAVEAKDSVIIHGTVTADLTVAVGLSDATLITVTLQIGTWSATFPVGSVSAETASVPITA